MSIDEELKNMNLETQFDENLKSVALCPADMRRAVQVLKQRPQDKSDLRGLITRLGRLGSYQLILGDLDDAENTLNSALTLVNSDLSLIKLKISNMIRLGNTYHLKKQFKRAHEIFDACHKAIKNQGELSDYLDFVYQHKGKCYLDEARFEDAMKCFYQAFLIRSNKSDRSLTDSTLLAIEVTKKRWLPQVLKKKAHFIYDKNMPEVVKSVIGKRHGIELFKGRFNCINAALAFHGLWPLSANSKVAKPMDLLQILKKRTIQVTDIEDFQFGDLLVWWNRSGGAWDEKKILIDQIDFEDPDFPYGLILDHVAVRITEQIVFNKPNSSPASEYRFDFVESASYPSQLGRGHEMTIHRVVR